MGLVVGTQKFHQVSDLLIQAKDNKKVIDLAEEVGSQNEIKHHLKKSKGPSAFVSIMQGCNMKCSFCIMPKTRGSERYRPMQEILDEIEILADSGVKRGYLLGQIVNAYGRGEFPRINKKSPFVQLLEKIEEIEGIKRIRFTSPHPTSYGDDLIDAFASLTKLGKYAHIPMQSGSNRILKAMNRPYKIERFLSIVDRLRANVPGMRLSTDVIVGFPGEKKEDYELTKEAFIKAGFEMGFIFKYSDRSGTPSVDMDGKVEQTELERRNQELLKILENQSNQSNCNLIGTELEILVESHAKKGEGQTDGKDRMFSKSLLFRESFFDWRLCEC